MGFWRSVLEGARSASILASQRLSEYQPLYEITNLPDGRRKAVFTGAQDEEMRLLIAGAKAGEGIMPTPETIAGWSLESPENLRDWITPFMERAAAPLPRMGEDVRALNTGVYLPDEYGGFEEVPHGYLKKLFPMGKKDEWPQVIFTSPDSRVNPWHVNDIARSLPKYIKDITGAEIDLITKFGDEEKGTKGKTIALCAIHSYQTCIHNVLHVNDRLWELHRNSTQVANVSPAAKAAAQMILEAATLKKDGRITILRHDTPEIFTHFIGHGFSKGGNSVTDIFRYILHEIGPDAKNENKTYQLAVDENGIDTRSLGDPSLAYIDIGGKRVETKVGDKLLHEIMKGVDLVFVSGADHDYKPRGNIVLPHRIRIMGDSDRVISLVRGINDVSTLHDEIFRLPGPPSTGQHLLGHDYHEIMKQYVAMCPRKHQEMFVRRFGGKVREVEEPGTQVAALQQRDATPGRSKGAVR